MKKNAQLLHNSKISHTFASLLKGKTYGKLQGKRFVNSWRGGRVVDCGGLENR